MLVTWLAIHLAGPHHYHVIIIIIIHITAADVAATALWA